MFVTAHALIGIIIFSIFSYFNILPLGLPYLLLMLFFSVIPDVDFVFSNLHRNLFTHTPFFWCIISIILFFINQNMWIILPVIVSHFLLDTLDYGVMIAYPFSTRKYGLGILGKVPNGKTKFSEFFKEYISNRKMLSMEIGILFMALLALYLEFIAI